MLWVIPAWACEETVLSRLRAPDATTAEPVLVRGEATMAGLSLVGAATSMRSAGSVAAWEHVLTRQEDQDEWYPEELGVERVERLDRDHIFQQVDLPLLFGSVHIRRQVVVNTRWRKRGSEVDNCWIATDPAPWTGAIAPWASDAPFQSVGFGGWQVRPLPGGGTQVSYQFWVESAFLPSLQSWAMSRTLPALMRAFEVRVLEIDG